MKCSSIRGGIHPSDNKYANSDLLPSLVINDGDEFIIPYIQHIGSPALGVVKKGQDVIAGEVIATASKGLSVPIHAPCSGVISGISKVIHPMFGLVDGCTLRAGGQDSGYKQLDNNGDLIEIVKSAGIVGLGGAGFPTGAKLSSVRRADTLLINGSECEPYLTCDYALMLAYPEKIIAGVTILKNFINVKTAIIAIEDNKKKAIEKLKKAAQGTGIDIVSVRTRYPQGGEKQLIKTVLSRTVPHGRFPVDIGVLINNVATVFAIYEAVTDKKPLYERVVTISGLVENPCNIVAAIGSTVANIFKFTENTFTLGNKLIFGGPMTGASLNNINIPVVKTTGGILLLDDRVKKETTSCIRCSKCINSCPMCLVPVDLERAYASRNTKQLIELNISACIECGSCTYVCPSGRLLSESIKTGKKRVAAFLAAKGRK